MEHCTAAGQTAEEIQKACTDLAPRVEASFVIDRLDYLYKGGRCSALSAFGGNLLKLKPCIEVKDGKMDTVKAAVEKCTAALGDGGRVLLRKSGTEPVLRVMAEAGTTELCEQMVDAIIAAMDTSGHLIEVKK